ncbi:MFS transporter [soil metagenome]
MIDKRIATSPGRVLALLFAANLLNFYDRTLPAVLAEPIRKAWGLSDVHIGLVGAAFTLAYALAGLPLGRLADSRSRKWIIAIGLVVWSLLTGVNGLVGGFISLLIVRVGIGLGEAAFAPAANALIADLYPSERRGRATGVLMLGLPIGMILAFFTTGAITDHFGTWRAPFFIAMVPGLILAVLFMLIREPRRGATDAAVAQPVHIDRPIRTLLSIPTFWLIIASGVTFTFAGYATTTFMVPNLQRYFGLSLTQAALSVGVIVGVTGLVALPLAGLIADALHGRFLRGRLLFGAGCLAVSAVLTWLALSQPAQNVELFIGLFAAGWFFQYAYFTTAYPAIHDVVPPQLRATAIAVFFAMFYVLGAAFGPLIVGVLSDHGAQTAMRTAGEPEMSEAFRSLGLHASLFVVPAMLLVTALLVGLSALRFPYDRRNP